MHYTTQPLLLSVADARETQSGRPQYAHSLAACARYIHYITNVTSSAAVVQHSQA